MPFTGVVFLMEKRCIFSEVCIEFYRCWLVDFRISKIQIALNRCTLPVHERDTMSEYPAKAERFANSECK